MQGRGKVGWWPVTSPQRTEAALAGWQKFLESKGVSTRIVPEKNGFTLERYGYSVERVSPNGGASAGNQSGG